MKWRLDEAHYDNDEMTLLPEGTEVGDGCANTWTYPESSANKALAGKPRPPSRSMSPLDPEAEKVWNQAFGEAAPDRDPTKAIPITPIDKDRDAAGNVKTQSPRPPGQPNPAPAVPNEPAKLGRDVTKDDSTAKVDPLSNKTPEQHRFGEDKPVPPANQPKK